MGKKIVVTRPKRVSRKKKKAIKNARIIYDVQSVPTNKGLSMEGIMTIWAYHGVIIWDSSKGGKQPMILSDQPNNKRKLRLVDVA
jgi:hypothetical protein